MVSIHSFEEFESGARPRRLMKYMLVSCTQGAAAVQVDEKRLVLHRNEVLTITSGQYHHFIDFGKAKGYILAFTLDFFCKDDADVELVFQNGLFCHFDENEIIPLPRQNLVNEQLEAIRRELEEKPYQYLVSVHARIELILVQLNRAKVERGEEVWKPDALFLKFLDLVRGSFGKGYDLSRIAGMLGSSVARLNQQSRLHAGKTAQHVMYGLVASEAKRMLIYQKKSVKEIAYQLGFNDPYYFSNFFKKYTGLSPKAFQEKFRR